MAGTFQQANEVENLLDDVIGSNRHTPHIVEAEISRKPQTAEAIGGTHSRVMRLLAR